MPSPTPNKISCLKDVSESKAFCIKPWVHLHVSVYGKVTPCCQAAWNDNYAFGDINQENFNEIWNGEKMREFRLAMLKDDFNFRCHHCYDLEKEGLQSHRTLTNSIYADKLPWVLETDATGVSPNAKPVSWDIRISNLCNFKCRICGHHSSSSWYEDAKALGLPLASHNIYHSHDKKVNRGVRNFDLLMQQLDFVIPDLEEISFAGGEPLISKEHYQILQKLIDIGKTNVRLRYHTNFSKTDFGGVDVFSLWRKFEDVGVWASLDDSGKRGELQRNGQKWVEVEENRKRMKRDCPDVSFAINSTINIFNIQHFPDFHRDWTKRGLINVNQITPHLLLHPSYYSIQILPKTLKLRIEEKINSHISWIKEYAQAHPDCIDANAPSVENLIDELNGYVKYMNAKDESSLIPQFKAITTKLDLLRGENTAETFPELAELFI
jgi:radical SAM protein with 4Fe4S-binding SPASM domain